jgi:hypothetical protein
MGTLRLSAEGTVGRGLSPAIWQAYGFIGGNLNDPSRFGFHFDDFEKFPAMTSETDQDGYYTYQDAGVTIAPYTVIDNSDGEFGVVQIAGNNADNDEGHLELGDGTAGLVRIDPTAGSRCVVAFEARVKRTTVVTNNACFAFGLGEPGFAAADALVDDTSAMVAAGKDFIGFQTLNASPSEIDAIYTIGGTATVNQITDKAGTLVADEWIKLGGVYDPMQASGDKLKLFIDGAEIEYDTKVTDAIISAGTAFPTDEEMTLVLLTKCHTQATTEHPVYADWWCIGSRLVDG